MGLAQFPCSRGSKSTRCGSSRLHRQDEMPLRGKKEEDSRGEQKHEHTGGAYYVPGTAPESSHPTLYLLRKNPVRQAQSSPPSIHWLRFGEVTCRRSHSQSSAEEGFKLSAVTPAPRLFPPSSRSGAQEGTLAGQKTRGKAPQEGSAELGGILSYPPLLALSPLHCLLSTQDWPTGSQGSYQHPQPHTHSRLSIHTPPTPPLHLMGPQDLRCHPHSDPREGEEHHPTWGCQLHTRLHMNLRPQQNQGLSQDLSPQFPALLPPNPQSVFPSQFLQPLPHILHTEKVLKIKLPNNSVTENCQIS